MKKTIFLIAFSIGLVTSLGSCKNEKKEIKQNAAESGMQADSVLVYQCPMQCEGEKTYPEPGNCPVCKMKLAAIKVGTEHEHHEEMHEHEMVNDTVM
ncbi:MAG: hypothetical protein KDC69_06255 [Flavobacteriaceae bacterium]|nr:hypothetical protein [Flavobacteriaceae bacterium]